MAAIPTIPECTDTRWSDTTLYTTCHGQPKSLPHANNCQKIYYANGLLACIPKGSYLHVCSQPSIIDNKLFAQCQYGASATSDVSFDMSTWQGEYLVLKDKKLMPT
jgi:hypothetical protein